MKIKQAKVAQGLHGETSNLLEEKKYDMTFDKGMLHIKLKGENPKNIGPFIVFPANIAWMKPEVEAAKVEDSVETTPPEVPSEPEAAKRGRPAKK